MQLAQFQRALYSALNGNISVPVFEDVEDGNAFPYVTIGDNQFSDFSTDTGSGAEVTCTVHVWSRADSTGETLEIQDEITAILDRSSLALDTWCNAGFSFEFSEVLRDPDGKTRHGVTRFNAIIGVEPYV